MNRKSPKYAGSQRRPKVEGNGLPDLQSFSDVAWLKWKATTGNAPSSIRYFASMSITNQETNGVLARVLSQARYTAVPAWPGYDVAANTEQGAALLGQ
jgi:ABC-type proline/glycine betaine transport system substrate-binding protein